MPISMPAYAIGILPLMTAISGCSNVKHAAFADDLGGVGKLIGLKEWWDRVCYYGPFIGYFAKASKSWLIVKEKYFDEAESIFHDSGLNITIEGRKHLGATIGSTNFKN